MKLTRRQLLQIIGAAVPSIAVSGSIAQSALQSSREEIALTEGRYVATRDSLKTYAIPDWFADAKFGIWSHWGPQSAVGDGDWYARFMYIDGSPQHDYHIQRFGPQSKVGYKDLIPLFTADRWDPDHLMDLYVRAGAKYFVSMGVHHDNFDLWNSKYQPRWNAVTAGPHKDIVGMWAAAARKRGLRFGVSEHLHNSYDWFAPSHLADTKGLYAGIPYDGANPAFSDLYHDYTGETVEFMKTVSPGGLIAPDRWKREYLLRVKDLIDQHQPDMLYTDGSEVVSKNGNLLLNFPLPASGELDAEEMQILQGITAWMSINGEGIFGTRPWTVFGEGPAMEAGVATGRFNADKQPDYTWQDVRFTTKGEMLYAFIQGWPPQREVTIASLAAGGAQNARKALDVRMLGTDETLKFTQDAFGVRVALPEKRPAAAEIGIGLRVNFA
jgi:alpha-L-fucosidase